MKEIREKYLELLSQNNPDKFSINDDVRTNYEKVQKAYEEIKESRRFENEEEDTPAFGYLFAVKKCFWSIFLGILLILGVYFLTYIAYEILNFTYKFFLTLIFVFFVIEYFFAHYFENEWSQYIFCIAVSFVFVLCLYFIKKYLEKRRNMNDLKRKSSIESSNIYK